MLIAYIMIKVVYMILYEFFLVASKTFGIIMICDVAQYQYMRPKNPIDPNRLNITIYRKYDFIKIELSVFCLDKNIVTKNIQLIPKFASRFLASSLYATKYAV